MAKDHYYPDSGTRNRASLRFENPIHRAAKASFGTASLAAAWPSAIESIAIRK
jgi:hypothetical protein